MEHHNLLFRCRILPLAVHVDIYLLTINDGSSYNGTIIFLNKKVSPPESRFGGLRCRINPSHPANKSFPLFLLGQNIRIDFSYHGNICRNRFPKLHLPASA